jgi:SAM-dependent methyltransferase
MTGQNLSGDDIANANLSVYRDPGSVNYWSTYSDQLLTAERVILQRIRNEVLGKSILDVGVGAGRTTPFLLEISRDYTGIDFSPEMVAACKRRYSGVNFLHCDARTMSVLGRVKYSLIFFSLNGIDCVNHEDRQRIYAEVKQAIRPSGYFLFSSHNLRDLPYKPWQVWRKTSTTERGSLRDRARRGYHHITNNLNYLRRCRGQIYGHRHATLLDPGQQFRLLTYFIDPDEQVAQLTKAGFRDVKAFDRWGTELSADSKQLDDVNPVHYLASALD